MTPQEMAKEAADAIGAGQRMSMVRPKGSKMPPKCPRGVLLCEYHNGSRVYSYDPVRVLEWLVANDLVQVRTA